MLSLTLARSRDIVGLFGPMSHKQPALGTEKLRQALENLCASLGKLFLLHKKREKYKCERKM